MTLLAPTDYREIARRRLPRFLFDYLDGGAGAEETLARNRADLGRILLRQRVLRDIGAIDLSTEILGEPMRLPLMLGPVGLGGMYARRGEVQAARAARAAGIPFCLSTVSLCSLEEVAEQAGGAPWLQLYVIKDRGFMERLLDRAWSLGVRTLVFTVDMPVPGIRYRDRRSGMAGPHAPLRRMVQAIAHPRWAVDVGLRGRPHQLGNLVEVLGRDSGMNDYIGWLGANFDPTITWADLDWLRSRWQGKLVIKGVLDPADARASVALGADGIVVSNHGGRQHDGVRSTVAALPGIVDAVGDTITVLADSGVRSGVDIVRMLALGARGVLLGRAWVYALAAGGGRGVADLIEQMGREAAVTMALSGARSLDQVDRSMLDDS